jgi:hypothetical protein
MDNHTTIASYMIMNASHNNRTVGTVGCKAGVRQVKHTRGSNTGMENQTKEQNGTTKQRKTRRRGTQRQQEYTYHAKAKGTENKTINRVRQNDREQKEGQNRRGKRRKSNSKSANK